MTDELKAPLARRALRLARWRAQKVARGLSGGALARERRVVREGISEYHRGIGGEKDVWLLRRNVHMIEKGLTMRPRRAQFALDYIAPTVSAFERYASRIGHQSPTSELRWMQSVLTEYFDATAGASSAIIPPLRSQFESVVTILGEHRSSGPAPVRKLVSSVDIGALTDLATSRRSVRWYTDQPVPREAVDRALRVAAESPTACNRQPYRFEVFDDPESVKLVSEIPGGTRGYADQIPGIIVVIGDMSAFFDERDRHLIYVDGSLASMGVVYGLEAQEIASCCINWPDVPEREAQMRKLLGLSKHEKVIMLISYGYADPAGLAPLSVKKEINEMRSFRKLR